MANWESIARAHGPMAFETAWRILGHVHDTEDAAQDALMDGLRLYHEDPGSAANWGGMLRRLATRRALDRLRVRMRRGPRVDIPQEAASPAGEQPEQVAAGRELADRLRAALAKLPERQATVFAMRYFGELTNPDIAAALEVSEHSVAVALHKARATLARLLDVDMPRPAGARGDSDVRN